METTNLPYTYRVRQAERVAASLKKVTERQNAVASGRVIPEAGELTIGTGRCLSATVMFLDICRYSARPANSRTEQQRLLLMMSVFFAEAIRVIEDFCGTVEKNTGDGLMAYFVDAEDQTAQDRGLAAALTIRKAADDLINPVFETHGIEPFRFRICLDHGPITVADIGASNRFRAMVAIGVTANIANKMLRVADPDTILLGDMVLTGLDPEHLAHVRLKAEHTGWVYLPSLDAYPFHEYTGRWA
jgi:class 3 adenylate cyclase